MDVIIALVISVIGCSCCNFDWGTLYTFVSIAISLYEIWIDYANDKTAKR